LVVWGDPLKVTTEFGRNPLPLTVRVSGAEPVSAPEGDTLVTKGWGLGNGWIATLATFDVASSIETVTSTAGPVTDPVGTTIFT